MGATLTVPAIETDGLTKHFGSTVALTDLTLDVRPGEVFGCLGPNGAGKTTLIRLLLGLLVPTSGRASVFGLDSQHATVAAHRRLAYVAGEANLWPSLTVRETLHLLGTVQGQVDVAYRDELVERFELDSEKKVRALSKGNRQKTILVAALMTRAELLILDEPTSGLDPLMEQAFRACVGEARERGQSVFLSSHILSEVEVLCDRIGILRQGRLVEVGTLAQMRHLSSLTIEASFDGPVPDVRGVEGVSLVVVQGSQLSCQVQGSVAPLLATLEKAPIVKLLSREPSLEELFLAHYDGTGETSSP